MALQRTPFVQRLGSSRDLVLVLLVVAAALVVVVAMTAIFGLQPGPSFEIVPDPAGILPF
jgi:hypothetical protein